MPTAKTEELTERLELLHEVAEKAGSNPEVSRLLDATLSVTQRILRASASSLFLIDPATNELYIRAADGEAANVLKQARLDKDSGIVGWVANHGKPLMVNDVAADNRFNRNIDEVTGFITKSVLAVPLIRGRKVIGVLELLNHHDGSPFNDQDLRVLTGLMSTEALIVLVSLKATAIANIKASRKVLDGCKPSVETMAAAVDVKDPSTEGHSRRVKDYTLLAARAVQLEPDDLQAVEFGALLHDIGKIGIDEAILRKGEALMPEEWDIIRKHPVTGAAIVGEIPYLGKARPIVLYHHERFDGSGYPRGLAGESIPIGARLVAVADAFDTMTTPHPYRAASSVDDAMNELTQGAGKQFCPASVDAFVSEYRKRQEALKSGAPNGVAAPVGTDQTEVDEIYVGEVRLVVKPPAPFQSMIQFRHSLRQVEGLRIDTDGWSEDEGNIVLLSLEKPVALERRLQGMSSVSSAIKRGKDIVVKLAEPE